MTTAPFDPATAPRHTRCDAAGCDAPAVVEIRGPNKWATLYGFACAGHTASEVARHTAARAARFAP